MSTIKYLPCPLFLIPWNSQLFVPPPSFSLSLSLIKVCYMGEGRVGWAEDAGQTGTTMLHLYFSNLPFLHHADKTKYVVMSRDTTQDEVTL